MSDLIDHGYVPAHTHTALMRYFNHRCHPGSFLTAVLQNDLMRAAQCADHINKPRIPEIATWIYHMAPEGSWGNKEKVDGWIAGNKFQLAYEQQRLVNILAGHE